MKDKKLSVVVPVYNESEILETTYLRLDEILKLSKMNYEIIFVDDGSKDESLSIIKRLNSKYKTVKYISLSKNFGHQIALYAGIEKSLGDAVITIDADLQDNPIYILKMIQLWQEGNEIVYGKRKERKGESLFKKETAKLYYKFLNNIADEKIPKDSGDFRLMDRVAVNELLKMKEKALYIRGMVSWIGYKQVEMEYIREERKKGKSKYTLTKMLDLAIDGCVSFSNKPIRWITYCGTILLILTVILISVQIITFFINLTYSIPSLKISLMGLFIAFQFIFLGILGEYILKIQKEVLNRPLYITKEESEDNGIV